MPRLFTGIELPQSIRNELASLRAPLPGAKWVEAANLHLTLRFAGDIGNRMADEWVAALDEIAISGFEMRLVSVGAFGGNDPRIVWAGAEAGPELASLAKANERAARAAGLAAESRAFKPHITLARLRYGRVDAVARWLERHGGYASRPFRIDHFTLFSSRPQVGGGPYATEATFPLTGALPGDYLDHGAGW